VIGFANVLPDFYRTAFVKIAYNPTVRYSNIIDDFVYSLYDETDSVQKYYDQSGKEYDRKAYQALLPFTYYRDLVQWEIYPDTIGGKYIPPIQAAQERHSSYISPSVMKMNTKRIKLYPLFESASDFTAIAMPGALFRIKERIEFINAKENKIDEEKSVLFTEALTKAGFVFPAAIIAGNPTTRKPYDFGYFLLDSAGGVFHMYMAKGVPVVNKTEIAPSAEIYAMTVAENDMDYYGLLVTADGEIYHILKDGYKLRKLYVENYDPLNNSVTYALNPLNISVTVSEETREVIYLSDRDIENTKTYSYTPVKTLRGVYKTILDIVFPLQIYSGPRVVFSVTLMSAFTFSLLLGTLYALFNLFRGKRGKWVLIDTLFILAGGIYTFITLILLEGLRNIRLRR
jgi:hypothetical protein